MKNKVDIFQQIADATRPDLIDCGDSKEKSVGYGMQRSMAIIRERYDQEMEIKAEQETWKETREQ